MILLMLLLVLLSAAVVATASTVLRDGYGSRPAPRSHHQDVFATR